MEDRSNHVEPSSSGHASQQPEEPRPSLIVRAILVLIRVYQLTISPLLGPTCRFEPTCSHYSMAVFRSHGLFRGLWLSTVRILKCQPFHPGGYDPPPPPPGHHHHHSHSLPPPSA